MIDKDELCKEARSSLSTTFVDITFVNNTFVDTIKMIRPTLASALPLLFLAKQALAFGCETHSYTTCEDGIVHWFDPDDGQICDPLDCGGGRARRRTPDALATPAQKLAAFPTFRVGSPRRLRKPTPLQLRQR
ncbi:hypothetical protein ACJZ2D_015308 [Fusarium nematophilum]